MRKYFLGNDTFLPNALQHECALLFFSQTTSVTRVGGPGGLLKVRVEIDKLGDLKLKISDLFGGRKIIGSFYLFIISQKKVFKV